MSDAWSNKTASPFSDAPYFPMLLSNGSDAVLIDYTGSMLSGNPSHAHREQNQGCPLGWYKASHCCGQKSHPKLQPIVQSGYFLSVNGEFCDIADYKQTFLPKQAILKTLLIAGNVTFQIEAFLTDESILAEKYEILAAPDEEVSLIFFVDHPFSWIVAADLINPAEIRFALEQDSALCFDYSLGRIKGAGAMLVMTNRPPDGFSDYPCKARGMHFSHVKTGDSFVKYTLLADDSEEADFPQALQQKLELCRRKSYAEIHAAHIAQWESYSGQSSLRIPDADLQYQYDLSLYLLKACQHPATGAIHLGLLPNLWCGGTCCPYDAFYAAMGLLVSNHNQESKHHLEFYHQQRSLSQKIMREAGLPGVAYSGWTDCQGNHKGRDVVQYLLKTKPVMSAIIALEYCWYNLYFPQPKLQVDCDLQVCREVADFAMQALIEERDQDAVIRPAMSGNESGIEVENDTFTAILFARLLSLLDQLATIYGISIDSSYRMIAGKLYAGLEGNYIDGVLYPYRNATRLAMAPQFFLFNLPQGIPEKTIAAALEKDRTPWGLDGPQLHENYRDWPWTAMRYAIIFSILQQPEKAFHWLKHSVKYISSLGAFPEKIRLDGYAVGYWYPSPHALFVWAVCSAIANVDQYGHLNLLQGLNGDWKNLQCENLRLPGGLKLSLCLKDGRIQYLNLLNTSSHQMKLILQVNPLYTCEKQGEITLLPGDCVESVA